MIKIHSQRPNKNEEKRNQIFLLLNNYSQMGIAKCVIHCLVRFGFSFPLSAGDGIQGLAFHTSILPLSCIPNTVFNFVCI